MFSSPWPSRAFALLTAVSLGIAMTVGWTPVPTLLAVAGAAIIAADMNPMRQGLLRGAVSAVLVSAAALAFGLAAWVVFRVLAHG